MSNAKASREPQILEYGPQRLIGLSRICKTSEDCKNVWADETGFMKRAQEIAAPAGQTPDFGLCRCATGAEMGAFDYAAAVPAPDGADLPEGMIEIVIPAGTYAAFPVAGLSEIGQAWGETGEWLASHPEWQGFCYGNPSGCGCVAHPSFEFYPPGFDERSGLFVYIPLQSA